MQKMISKLIKHLEMRSTEHRAEGTTYREVVADTIDMCIDVIKLFAKEYGGGWIPVSSGKLPKHFEKVQVTWLGYHSNEPISDGSTAFIDETGRWCWVYGNTVANVVIVAWRENLEPYKESEE